MNRYGFWVALWLFTAGAAAQEAATDPAPPTVEPVEEARPAADAERDLTVDAMVGQIYGKPVFATQVFREIGDDTLARLGQTLTRLDFKAEARELIDAKLMEWVVTKLRLAEAEASLKETERQSLPGIRKLRREQVIAQEGGGVPSLAEEKLRQTKGWGLDTEVDRYIQGMVLSKYREDKIRPFIHVNRREVERFYQDHFKDFNPPPSATLRLIVVRDASAADRVDADLAAGKPFDEVAKEHGTFRAESGGLLDPFQLKGPFAEFNELGWPAVNEKVRTLHEGDHTGRVEVEDRFYWAKLEKLQDGKPRSLQEVFLDVERRLKLEKEDRLGKKLMVDLLRKGNYTPVKEMATELLNVAMVRYARE